MSISEVVPHHIDKNESIDSNDGQMSLISDSIEKVGHCEESQMKRYADTETESNMTVAVTSNVNVEHILPTQDVDLLKDSGTETSLPIFKSTNVEVSSSSIQVPDVCFEKFKNNKEINSDKMRRNSLPETIISDLKKCTLNHLGSISHDSHSIESQSGVLKAPSLSSERLKVAPNISDVVKNVHGLFNSLRNVYKEKHIGDMIQATQKNITSAKNGCKNMKQEIFNDAKQTSTQKEILETLNKYTSLNLSSEEQELESYRKRTVDMKNGSHESCTSEEKEIEAPPDIPITPVPLDDDTVLHHSKQIQDFNNLLLQKDKMYKELEIKHAEICKQLETSVMRYAMSERQILCMEKTRTNAVEKETRAKEEVALLERRLKAANSERTRICDMLDEKSHEVLAAQKEMNKLKEELASADTKLKWVQNKLLSEMEAHKETSSLAEKLGQQVAQQEVAWSGSSGGTGPDITPQYSSTYTTLTDVEIKEMEASTILERHERQRLEEKCKSLQKELEQMKASLKAAMQHSEELKGQAESNAGEAAALRDVCNELRMQAAKDCERLAAAQARAARLDTVSGQLQQEQEKCFKLLIELEEEKKARSAAQAEAELSARREAELLRQTERLTEAGVGLQATCSEAEAKALALSIDNASLRSAAEREAERVALARSEAEAEKRGREVDARALAAAAARHQRAERIALQRAEQLEGDLRVMAIKHASTVKELKREIKQWKRKVERIEIENQGGSHSNEKITERTGSCSSLSSYEGSTSHMHSHSHPQPCQDDNGHVDRQQLVEKIVELQRAGARRSERLDFLEGHSVQLTAELQKKSKLLRVLMASMPAGALAAPASDRAKVEIGRHGGIMASLFTHEISDSSMSLELVLEMTAKLQAVLEDTLLKNITLKENMDTLGDEITLLREKLNKRPTK